MNLLEEKLKQLPDLRDEAKVMRVLGFVQKRMGHSDLSTMQRYLNYKNEKAMTVAAQSNFEKHLQEMAESYLFQ